MELERLLFFSFFFICIPRKTGRGARIAGVYTLSKVKEGEPSSAGQRDGGRIRKLSHRLSPSASPGWLSKRI